MNNDELDVNGFFILATPKKHLLDRFRKMTLISVASSKDNMHYHYFILAFISAHSVSWHSGVAVLRIHLWNPVATKDIVILQK